MKEPAKFIVAYRKIQIKKYSNLPKRTCRYHIYDTYILHSYHNGRSIYSDKNERNKNTGEKSLKKIKEDDKTSIVEQKNQKNENGKIVYLSQRHCDYYRQK